MSDIETGTSERPENIISRGVTPEERHQLIAEAAYYRAERRGFAPGAELEDWLEAEAEINRRLAEAAGPLESPI